jgi:hypothetical protein
MSIKQMLGAVTGAVGSTIINGGKSIDTTFELVNEGLGYALKEMKVASEDQAIDHVEARAKNLVRMSDAVANAALSIKAANDKLEAAGITKEEAEQIKALLTAPMKS